MYDGDVLSQCPMYQSPEEFFSFLEYIIADAGYGAFCSGRVTIEHCNDIIKNRFASLKGLPHQVKKKEHFQGVMQWILAILTLHNMLISFRDEWDDEDPQEDTEEEAIAYHATLPLNAEVTGNKLRIRVSLQKYVTSY